MAGKYPVGWFIGRIILSLTAAGLIWLVNLLFSLRLEIETGVKVWVALTVVIILVRGRRRLF